MSKNTKTIFFFLIISLFSANLFLIYRLNHNIHESQKLIIENKEIRNTGDNRMRIIKMFKDFEIFQFVSNDIRISKELQLTASNGQIFKLSDVLKGGAKFIMRFDKQNCSSCISYLMSWLKKNENAIGKENIVLLASYNELNMLNIFKDAYKIDYTIYNISNLELPVERANIPFFLIIDKSYYTRNIYIPKEEFPAALTEQYLSIVKGKYFRN
jgi:hypothetical protein